MIGYLYIFQEGDNDLYKCGISENWPDIRRGQLQTGNPRPLKKIAYYRLSQYKAVETLVHHRLRAYGTDGGTEWFSCRLETVLETVKVCVSEVEHKHFNWCFSVKITLQTLYLKGRKTVMGFIKVLAYIWTIILALFLFAATSGAVGLQFYF